MHYRITDSIIVRSENAALSATRASLWVLQQLQELPPNSRVLDYGCGKLRYTIPLAKRNIQVVAIDSKSQLSRKQRIFDEYSDIRSYVQRYLPTASVFAIDDPIWKSQKYDFVLCANVLSSIPNEISRLQVLRDIHTVLHPYGNGLILNQYRNSYFKKYSQRDDCEPFFDGWLIKRGDFYSFYGLIHPTRLRLMCETIGLKIHKCGCAGQIGFCIVRRATP